MESINELLSKVEAKGFWAYFHKDWLLQIRNSLRPQLPGEYYLFVESEAILVAPETDRSPSSTMPDVAIVREQPHPPDDHEQLIQGTLATIEVDEPYEAFTKYVLLIRRAPRNRVVAAIEMLSPSNKGTSSLVDKEKYLRKRTSYFEAGINLLEIDALVGGDRITPESLSSLNEYDRFAWTTFHAAGQRRLRGWGWNQQDPPPSISWTVESGVSTLVDLNSTADEARKFNQWEQLVQ